MRTTGKLLTACCSVLVVAACGTETHRSIPQVQESAFADQLGKAEAKHTERCCKRVGLRGLADDFMEDVAKGVANDRPAADSGATYDVESASACIDAYAHAECSLLKGERSALPGCSEIYTRGHRKLGEPCTSFYECEQPNGQATTCWIGAGQNERICQRVLEVDEGEPCMSDDAELTIWCKSPLLCDDVSKRCVAAAKRGEACLTGGAWGDTCAIGSVCNAAGNKRCVEPTAVGQACDLDSLCEGGACFEGQCREPLFETTGGWMCKMSETTP